MNLTISSKPKPLCMVRIMKLDVKIQCRIVSIVSIAVVSEYWTL